MPVSKKDSNTEKKQKKDKSCPICKAPVRPGFDTKYGKVLVCANYPKCSFFVILHPMDDYDDYWGKGKNVQEKDLDYKDEDDS